MKKWFLSILSEKNGKGSAKRFAGLFASVIFFEVIQIIVIEKSIIGNKNIATICTTKNKSWGKCCTLCT